jgi:hypothetical protein
MAKRQSKQSKSVAPAAGATSKGKTKAPKVAPLAGAVKVAYDSIAPALVSIADVRELAATTGTSASETIRGALIALRTSESGKSYDDAIAALFGNGLKGKAHTGGRLRECVPEERRLSVAVTLSNARKLATWIKDAKAFATFKAAPTFKQALAKAKEAEGKVAAPRDNSAKAAGESQSLPQLIASASIPLVLETCAAILADDKATAMQAKTLTAIAAQVKALTAKAA